MLNRQPFDPTAFAAFKRALECSPDTVDLALPSEMAYLILDLIRPAEDGEAWEPTPHTSGEREMLSRLRCLIMDAQDAARAKSGFAEAMADFRAIEREHNVTGEG